MTSLSDTLSLNSLIKKIVLILGIDAMEIRDAEEPSSMLATVTLVHVT